MRLFAKEKVPHVSQKYAVGGIDRHHGFGRARTGHGAGQDRLDWSRERAAEFNELFPQYEVTIEGYADYESIFAAASLAFEQGTQPAIVQYFEAATQDARDAGFEGNPQFKSVAEAFGDRTEVNGLPVNFDDFVDAARNYYTLDGSFTSFPWNTSSAIMFSNKTMLEAAGVEGIPATWAEVDAACEKIMAMENAPANCITWPNHGWFFEQAVAMQGADLVNNGNGREARATETFINSDAAVAYVSWWKDLQDKGYYIYTGAQRDWGGTYNAFVAGQVAMLLYSSSDTTALTNDGAAAGFDVVASFYPHNQDVEYAGNLIGGASLWLSNDLSTEVEDGALTFLLYFTNTENAASWHQFTGYVPITKSAIALLESEGWYEENPNSLVASDQLAAAIPSSATAGAIVGAFPAIRNHVTNAIEQVLVNGRDVTEALTEAKELADETLAEYNLLYAGE
ncbi:MAG: extracellular solute-binding protein [Chloroflexi bacterium]|nr:extracellular solute-binding protein [Chloroflexota bacterium]